MDLNFISDPNLIPKPRHEIRIESLKLSPYPDGRRIRIEIEITPFGPADRPNLEIEARRPDESEAGFVSVVETMQRAISLTMHLQQPGSTAGQYRFTARLFFEPGAIQHSIESTVDLVGQTPSQQE